jgi:hypothetical protein
MPLVQGGPGRTYYRGSDMSAQEMARTVVKELELIMRGTRALAKYQHETTTADPRELSDAVCNALAELIKKLDLMGVTDGILPATALGTVKREVADLGFAMARLDLSVLSLLLLTPETESETGERIPAKSIEVFGPGIKALRDLLNKLV